MQYPYLSFAILATIVRHPDPELAEGEEPQYLLLLLPFAFPSFGPAEEWALARSCLPLRNVALFFATVASRLVSVL
jgi:hypothetical protein